MGLKNCIACEHNETCNFMGMCILNRIEDPEIESKNYLSSGNPKGEIDTDIGEIIEEVYNNND